MPDFRPTVAARGRLARLGVVLDTRNAAPRVREVARMCDRAGIEAIWVRDHLVSPDREPRLEAWTALTLAASETSSCRVGMLLNVAFRPPGVLAAMAGTLDASIGGRLELALTAGWVERELRSFGFVYADLAERTARMEGYGSILRRLLSGERASSSGTYDLADAELGVASPQPGGPKLSVEAATPQQAEVAARIADDVLFPAKSVRDIDAAVAEVQKACARFGRDPVSLGIALELPVSIGRTPAEAHARADPESLFEVFGHPSEVGIFGTLEQCQERVIRLAHAGVTDLRCILPNTMDIPDVIAQLTAMTAGTVEVLSPHSPRSKPPDPPRGWGGRAAPREVPDSA